MLNPAELATELQNLSGVPAVGIFTRYVDFGAYQSAEVKDLLFDGGPPLEGKRYTPKGGPKGLYLGEDCQTARTEFADGTLAALNPSRSSASIHLDAFVKLRSVLDLGNASIRRRLETSLDELKSTWRGYALLHRRWPVTWILGQAVFDSECFDGIRFPSAKVNRRYNLLILTERLGPGAEVRIDSGSDGHPLARKTGTFRLKP